MAGGLLLPLLSTLSFSAEMETTGSHYRLYENLLWIMFVMVSA